MAIKNYKKGDSVKLSPNFRAREFDCHGRGCCSETKVDDELIGYLQRIRERFGKPVYINSGYRCPEHNRAVDNASRTSKHLQGMAADITVEGIAPLEVAKFAESIGVKGIGLYDTFVHIDTRQTKGFWYSHAQEYRDTFGAAYSQEQFVRDVQRLCGDKTVTLSARINRTHPVVVCVQKRLYALGYTGVGKADGIAGAKFTAAVKAFQRDNGCVSDGEITAGKKTWRVLLGEEVGR